MINIVHKLSKDGTKTFAMIQNISALPKGFECPPQINENVYFNTEDWDENVFAKLSDFTKEMILKSPEAQKNRSLTSEDLEKHFPDFPNN